MTLSSKRRWLLLLLAPLLLVSCADLGYYRQALAGHWQLIDQRRPLDDVLTDSAISDDLRRRLILARELREFASRRLALPDNGSYRSYVDVGRRQVAYNVFAAPRLSLRAKTWCFPLLGCVAYRGYFSEQAARDYAAGLERQGYDVFVGGVPAYSTLGWFDDPLLSTFLGWSPGRLAELMFHELAHQQLYIADDTAFNESFATAVGQLGAELWLADKPLQQQVYRQRRRYRKQFAELVLASKQKLAQLYASGLPIQEQRVAKDRLFDELRQGYERLKDSEWQGYSGYDRWFASELNNAKLAAFSSYSRYVPAFVALFEREGRDFAAFYRAAGRIGALAPARRHQQLQTLLKPLPAAKPT